MKLFEKVKNLFTEEYEEEEPIKKEVKHVEITPPRREVIHEEPKIEPVRKEPEVREPISDSVVLNREEKFKFPVYFDDKDFEDLPKKAKKPVVEEKKEVKVEPYQGAYQGAKLVEEKKHFQVSPIISPVYGILDKNYQKEDIMAKHEKPITTHYHREESLTIDEVRNKAYGTLEDDLESTLFGQVPVVKLEPSYPESSIDIFGELEQQENRHEAKEEVDLSKELELQKQKIDEINAFIKQNTVSKPKEEDDIFEDLEQTKRIKIEKSETIEKELPEEDIFELPQEEEKKDVDNGELFNLIDSMYEKREEE